MATIRIHAAELSGTAGLSLFLRNQSTGVLLNAGGDALTEDPAGSGRFTADVAETIEGIHYAIVKDGSGRSRRDGYLDDGATIVQPDYPSATGGGGGSVDYDLIASSVYQLLRGASAVLLKVPVPGELFEVTYNCDLSMDIPCSTTSGARIILSIGCENADSPLLTADTTSGLLSIAGQASVPPADAVVTRVDGTKVRIYVRARSLKLVARGQHSIEIREIIGTQTNPKFKATIELTGSAGQIVAS
jgi:hypothetical protein